MSKLYEEFPEFLHFNDLEDKGGNKNGIGAVVEKSKDAFRNDDIRTAFGDSRQYISNADSQAAEGISSGVSSEPDLTNS